MKVYIFSIFFIFLLLSCSKIPDIYEYEFKCKSDKDCIKGYFCHPQKKICVKEGTIIDIAEEEIKEKIEDIEIAEDLLIEEIADVVEIYKEEITEIEEEDVFIPECLEDEDCIGKFELKEIGQCKKPVCNYESKKCELEKIEDGTSCNDGDDCTDGDKCENGVCIGGEKICDCITNEDCIPFDDGDVCNGIYKCDLENFPYKCVFDPETVIKCDTSKNTSCMENLCDKKTGECKMTPINEGELCDDGNKCTIDEKCVSGECKSVLSLYCDDDNPCTDNKCEPQKGCVFPLNTNPCDDNNACTENDTCVVGKCLGPNFRIETSKFMR